VISLNRKKSSEKNISSSFLTTNKLKTEPILDFRVKATLRTEKTKRLIKGWIQIHQNKLLFEPKSDSPASAKHFMNIDLSEIHHESIEERMDGTSILCITVKKPGFIKDYHFIVDTSSLDSFYPKLECRQHDSKEDYLEQTLNLELTHVSTEEDTDDILTLLQESDILTTDALQTELKRLYKFIASRHRIYNLTRLYISSKEGKSLRTFYENAQKESPTLLLIKDSNGFIFGYYSTENWAVRPNYYGTGESFLFSLAPKFHVYKWTHLNSYFQYTTDDSICIGGGTNHQEEIIQKEGYNPTDTGCYGLRIDSNLIKGTSHICDTYLNRTLSATSEFTVEILELWAFSNLSSSPFRLIVSQN